MSIAQAKGYSVSAARRSPHTVLGIETSCDETAAAIVAGGTTILADIVASQAAMHARWGGVVPELASRQHLEAIVPVVDAALAAAGLGWDGIDAVAVTNGPGLIGALMVGLSYAKSISLARDLPLVGVDHVMGHVYAGFLGDAPPALPFLALIVSGGHTDLVRVAGHGDFAVIGATRDDAAGEAFDKVARLLGLGYPGGPAVDRLASHGDPRAIRWPSPRLRDAQGHYDFSFSGLKTAVLYHLQRHGMVGPGGRVADSGPAVDVSGTARADVAASFQAAVATALAETAVEAALDLGLSTVVLAGGVAANSTLRAVLADAASRAGLRVVIPPVRLCTDNATMIAAAGYFELRRGRRDGPALTAYSRSRDNPAE